jgi:hypothetical protein
MPIISLMQNSPQPREERGTSDAKFAKKDKKISLRTLRRRGVIGPNLLISLSL